MKQIQGNKVSFDISGGAGNQGFEKSGFHSTQNTLTSLEFWLTVCITCVVMSIGGVSERF